jgi:ATP-dependent helicase HrpB
MDLTEAVLILASSGIESIRDFPWFENPDPAGLNEAIDRLQILGALDASEKLTEMGRRISHLPVPPRYGRIMEAAARTGCLEIAALITALSQSRPLFPARKRQPDHVLAADFADPDDVTDFQALIRAWSQMKQNRFSREVGERLGIHAGACRDVDRIVAQLTRMASRWHSNPNRDANPSPETLAKVLLTGFSDRLAIRHSASTLSCAVIGGRKGQLEKGSLANDKEVRLFLAGEMIEVEGREVNVKLNLCTRIEEDWLRDLFPDDFEEYDGAVWDSTVRRVEARKERRFRDLVLETRASGEAPREMAASMLAGRVLSGELNLKAWDDKVSTWIARINLAAEHCPNYEFPAIDDDSRLLMLEQI